MEYHEAADVLFGLRRFRSEPGTDTTAALLAELDNPHTTFDCIQIAGSNGKGSSARMLASILEAAGFRVGLYTSPHLETVRDRVHVDGNRISKQRIQSYVETIAPYLKEEATNGESPTFFEALTGLALWQFDQENVDVAVLEVGIGGRYDATSVVDPIASAVTNVTLEHTDVLGDTIGEIARDKATVATDTNPLVTAAEGKALTTIDETVPQLHQVTADGSGDTTVTYHGRINTVESSISIHGPDYDLDTRLSLVGRHQALNAGVAAALARQLREIDPSTIATGLRQAWWPGRFEIMDTAPLVIMDGAHNPGACQALTSTLAEFDYDECHLVVGAMHDKDLAGMAAALPTPTTVTTVKAAIDRAADPTVLASVFDTASTSTSIVSSVEAGVHSAIDAASPTDCVLVTGSLAVIAEARRHWTRTSRRLSTSTRMQPDTIFRVNDIESQSPLTDAGALNHHVIRLETTTPEARRLQTTAASSDVAVYVAGTVDIEREPVPVILAGTTTAFQSLLATMPTLPAIAHYANPIRATIQDDVRGAWRDGTAVMGILNVTPDSFHDGGEYNAVDDAIDRAKAMVDHGASIIDVGGESTRPGADPVPVAEERDRVVPVIEAIADLDASISVDTRRATVAASAVDAGADIINDVSGLSDPEMRFTAAANDATLVIMHSLNTPVNHNHTHVYDDVVADVIAGLVEPVRRARQAGVPDENIIVDPGLGFGKSPTESFTLLNRIDELHAFGYPVMVGHSHKSMFGAAGFDATERTAPTIAGTALAADRGADIIRVHDVADNVAAVQTTSTTRISSEDTEL